jgi:hypothetical protein
MQYLQYDISGLTGDDAFAMWPKVKDLGHISSATCKGTTMTFSVLDSVPDLPGLAQRLGQAISQALPGRTVKQLTKL